MQNKKVLISSQIETNLGPMIAISNEKSLLLLEFIDRNGLEKEIDLLKLKCSCAITSGETKPIKSIKKELKKYFAGKLKKFKTPILFEGTSLQNSVWKNVKKIPYGTTVSYSEISKQISNPKAIRAVASAIGNNQLAIIIPCHRVISKSGEMGGYSGGLYRKKHLHELEKNQANKKESYYFYMVRCFDNSLYCGKTNDLKRRLKDHNSNSKKSAKYTRARGPVQLVYNEPYESASKALRREYEVKQWSKEKKEELVKSGLVT